MVIKSDCPYVSGIAKRTSRVDKHFKCSDISWDFDLFVVCSVIWNQYEPKELRATHWSLTLSSMLCDANHASYIPICRMVTEFVSNNICLIRFQDLNLQDVYLELSDCYEIWPASRLPRRRSDMRRHQMETFPRYWPFVRGIHRSQVNSPHEGQWVTRSFDVSLICAWTNGWVNHRDTGDLRRHRAHYDVTDYNVQRDTMI